MRLTPHRTDDKRSTIIQSLQPDTTSISRAADNKRVAIVQSNYIPWKGYFDLIDSVDEFIILDTVQFTRRDWRNRNTIKTQQGLRWLTIPVMSKGRYHQRICDTSIATAEWNKKHWDTIKHAYTGAPHFQEYSRPIEDLYASATFDKLSSINLHFINGFCHLLGITTPIISADNYDDAQGKTNRLVHLCKQARATEYVSGPSARQYLQTEAFTNEGLQVSWFDYNNYVEYSQHCPPFTHNVSLIDLLFQTGDASLRMIRTRTVEK